MYFYCGLNTWHTICSKFEVWTKELQGSTPLKPLKLNMFKPFTQFEFTYVILDFSNCSAYSPYLGVIPKANHTANRSPIFKNVLTRLNHLICGLIRTVVKNKKIFATQKCKVMAEF